MDTNKDGVITFDEFCDWCQNVSIMETEVKKEGKKEIPPPSSLQDSDPFSHQVMMMTRREGELLEDRKE